MEKEFIPYEQSLALRELKFNEICLANYSYRVPELRWKLQLSISNNETIGIIASPLYQQAFKWFRNKHNLQAEVIWRGDMDCFCYKTGRFKQGSHDFSKEDYETYEEAELECLKKLIEICKKN